MRDAYPATVMVGYQVQTAALGSQVVNGLLRRMDGDTVLMRDVFHATMQRLENKQR